MIRTYFKRLDYHKEDIPTKAFSMMTFETEAKEGLLLTSIEDGLETETKESVHSLFDFTKTNREKNCGLGDNYVDEVKEKRNSGFYLRFDGDYQNEHVVFIRFKMDAKNDVLYDQSLIRVADGVSANVIIYYDSDDSACFRNGLLSVDLGVESSLNLIKVQNLSNASRNFETMKVQTKFKSKLDGHLVEFGSAKSGASCSIYMPEEWGEINIHPMYFVDGERNVDLEQNLVINGKNSLGIIEAKGVVNDTARKMFRGNVFLNRGCKRSIGRFSDHNIMLSKKARALSIPTIMCDEDDVMGEHAGSFETTNKKHMHYLMARGFDERTARKLIVRSIFVPVFSLIENTAVREHLIEKLNSKL